MKPHPYLRAYMAGIVVPTLFLPVGVAIFAIARFAYNMPIPIERAMVFQMAVVPNLWGLWNMLYVALRSRRHLPLGFHGALLPLLLMPGGVTLAHLLDIPMVTPSLAVSVAPVALALYYLVWKHLVGYCNDVVGVA